MFLVFFAAGVEAYLRGQTSARVVGLTASLLFCGCIALLSAWHLYHLRRVGTLFYGLSWAVIVLGWLALNVMQGGSVWLTVPIALLLAYRAVQNLMAVQRDLASAKQK